MGELALLVLLDGQGAIPVAAAGSRGTGPRSMAAVREFCEPGGTGTMGARLMTLTSRAMRAASELRRSDSSGQCSRLYLLVSMTVHRFEYHKYLRSIGFKARLGVRGARRRRPESKTWGITAYWVEQSDAPGGMPKQGRPGAYWSTVTHLCVALKRM